MLESLRQLLWLHADTGTQLAILAFLVAALLWCFRHRGA
jgi:hypothetical protein